MPKRLTPVFIISLLLLPVLSLQALAQMDSGLMATVADTFSDDRVTYGKLRVDLVSDNRFAFKEAADSRNVSLKVSNPTGDSMDVYLAAYQEGDWNILGKMGTVGPESTTTFVYPLDFSYNGRSVEVDRFGVVGHVDDRYLGSHFEVVENWEAYEQKLKSTLSMFGVVSSGVLVGILIIALAGVYVVASQTKHDEVTRGEYSFKTLFFPMARMRPMSEKIANILINPFFWLLELICGAILVGLILMFALTDIRSDIGLLVFIVGGVAALFMPIIFLIIGYLADYYEREPFRFILAMFMWGVMSTLFAFFINTLLSMLLGATMSEGLALVITAVLIAPVVEEVAKGTGLLVISGHHEYDDAFDGILYGFAIGMGFAAVENWLYFASNASPVAVGGLTEWAYNILYRSFLCALAHGGFTAAIGGMIGYFKSKNNLRVNSYKGFLIGLPIAIVLHGIFNFTAIIDAIIQTALGVPVPVFDPILTIAMTLFYIILGIMLQRRIRDRLKRKLNV